jgi:hypothetical protein
VHSALSLAFAKTLTPACIDTFSSDYDEFFDEFGTEFEAHGA